MHMNLLASIIDIFDFIFYGSNFVEKIERINAEDVYSKICEKFKNNSISWDKGESDFVAVSMEKHMRISRIEDSLLVYNGPSYHADRVKTFFKKAGYYEE